MAEPKTLISFQDLAGWRAHVGSARVAFVPTMGALHDGHLTLVKQAKERADRVVVSIFVNPIQFGPKEDFAKYPRTLAQDIEKLTSVQCDAVFTPNTAEFYPPGFQTYVQNKSMSEVLCGASRPGHFEGVCTVVLKLFNLVRPHAALFGKKDFQQWRIIERMTHDLMVPVEVVGCEIVREADGLAMSSRNRYLGEEDRKKAASIYRGLQSAQAKFKTGIREPAELVNVFQETLAMTPGFTIEYAEIRGFRDLQAFEQAIVEPAVLLVATRLGGVRLIDNIELKA